MARDKGVVFRDVPWAIQQRGLQLAAKGVAGPKADGSDALRLALEVGLIGLEGATSAAPPRGSVRLCREAGAVLLADVPEDAPEVVRDVVAGLAAECVRAGVLVDLSSPRPLSDAGRKAGWGSGTCDAPPALRDSSDVRYAQAYAAGIAAGAAGVPWTLSPADAKSIGSTIGPALRAHATERGTPITGDALLSWIQKEAEAFRRATAHEPKFWGAWAPRCFARWLNSRSDTETGTAQPAAARTFAKGPR